MYKFNKCNKKEYLEAVKQDGDALQYVENYYEELEQIYSCYLEEYRKEFENENKEMTIAEIEKKLGYSIKIVK